MKLNKRLIGGMVWLVLVAFPASASESSDDLAGFAEVGKLDRISVEPQRLNLLRRYTDLVVIAQPPSYKEPVPAIVRLGQVHIPAQGLPSEWVFLRLQPNELRRRMPETVSYLATEPGLWLLDGGSLLAAGKVEIAWRAADDLRHEPADRVWSEVRFPPGFSESPIVLTQVQTLTPESAEVPVTTRTQNVTRMGFEVALDAEGAPRPDRGKEIVGWLAIAPDVVSWSGHAVLAGQVRPDRLARTPWLEIPFRPDSFREPPRFLASQADYGDSRPAHLRYSDLTEVGVKVLIEDARPTEAGDIHYLAIEGSGVLGGDPAQPLEVNLAGSGSGIVTSVPPGIDCPGDCSEAYADGTVVALTPTPATGSVLTGWDCDESSSDDYEDGIEVVMDRQRRCVVTFELTHQLDVTLAGTGAGSVASAPAGIDCPGDCSEVYVHGTRVTLTPTAATGSIFTGWSGDCRHGRVTMDADRACTATFEIARQLDVTLAGAGSGGVTSAPPGIRCPGDCSDAYADGTVVTLTPEAPTGFIFVGWSGDCVGGGADNQATVTMDTDRACTATFEIAPFCFKTAVETNANSNGPFWLKVNGGSCTDNFTPPGKGETLLYTCPADTAFSSLTVGANAPQGNTKDGWLIEEVKLLTGDWTTDCTQDQNWTTLCPHLVWVDGKPFNPTGQYLGYPFAETQTFTLPPCPPDEGRPGSSPSPPSSLP